MGLLDDAIREHLDLKRKRGADPGEIERLEREALGPVRRDRATRSMDAVPHLEVHPEPEAPAFHPNPGAPGVDGEAPAGREPKRGFLRRNRPVAQAEPEPTDFNQQLADEAHGDPFSHEHDDPFTHEHGDPLVHNGDDHPHEVEPPMIEPAVPAPPHLVFDSPLPTRPDFTSPPPGVAPPEPAPADVPDDQTEEHAATGPPGSPVAPPVPEPTEAADLGETREWDVEDAFAAEDDAPQQAAPPPEDPLEETPEFLQDTPDHDRLWFEQRPPRDFDFDS